MSICLLKPFLSFVIMSWKCFHNFTACVHAKSFRSGLTRRTSGPWPTRLSCPWDSPGKNTIISLHRSPRKAFLSLLAIVFNSAFEWIYLSFPPLIFTSFLSYCKAFSFWHRKRCPTSINEIANLWLIHYFLFNWITKNLKFGFMLHWQACRKLVFSCWWECAASLWKNLTVSIQMTKAGTLWLSNLSYRYPYRCKIIHTQSYSLQCCL